jgi:hypothetical protein
MNLKEMNKPISAGEFSNNIQSAFGVKVDISKLDLDHTQKLLLTVKEEIKKQRLSEDRHSLHKSKSYLAKVFIRENLQKHIEELQEAKPDFLDLDKDGDTEEPMKDAEKVEEAVGSAADPILDLLDELVTSGESRDVVLNELIRYLDGGTIADFVADFRRHNDMNIHDDERGEDFTPGAYESVELDEKKHKEPKYEFDTKGLQALRILVGGPNMQRAKTAIEMAMNGKSVPAMYVKTFLPLLNMLDDIMRSGMANVQLLKNIDKRAKRSLGLESTEVEISDKLRKLYESQEDQAELLLASKDIVDRVQKAVDDLSKLRNEDLPPLLDAMRNELGSEMSEAYSAIAIPTLDGLVQSLGDGRETLAQASRVITGEEAPAEQMGAEFPAEEPVEELPAEEEFATADVAAGEDAPEGREERE